MNRGWMVAGVLALVAAPAVPAAAAGVAMVLERVDDPAGMLRWIRTGDVLRYEVRLNGMGGDARLAVAATPAYSLKGLSCARARPADTPDLGGAAITAHALASRALAASEGTVVPGASACRLGDLSAERSVQVVLSVPSGAEEVELAAVARVREEDGGMTTVTRTATAPVREEESGGKTFSRTATGPVREEDSGRRTFSRTATAPVIDDPESHTTRGPAAWVPGSEAAPGDRRDERDERGFARRAAGAGSGRVEETAPSPDRREVRSGQQTREAGRVQPEVSVRDRRAVRADERVAGVGEQGVRSEGGGQAPGVGGVRDEVRGEWAAEAGERGVRREGGGGGQAAGVGGVRADGGEERAGERGVLAEVRGERVAAADERGVRREGGAERAAAAGERGVRHESGGEQAAAGGERGVRHESGGEQAAAAGERGVRDEGGGERAAAGGERGVRRDARGAAAGERGVRGEGGGERTVGVGESGVRGEAGLGVRGGAGERPAAEGRQGVAAGEPDGRAAGDGGGVRVEGRGPGAAAAEVKPWAGRAVPEGVPQDGEVELPQVAPPPVADGEAGPGAPLPRIVEGGHLPVRAERVNPLVGVAGLPYVAGGIGVLLAGLWAVAHTQTRRMRRKVF